MITVDHIEAWRGQRVIDEAGADLGKLDDVFFDTDSGTPLLVSVKSGLLGRRTTYVPLEGARVGPDYVRVAYGEQTVSGAGPSRSDAAPGGEELTALGSAYGLRFADRIRLRSATEIEEHEAEAAAARERAAQLEAEAQAKIAAHAAARERAQSAGEEVGQAELEAEQARRQALEARQAAEGYDGER